MSKASLLAGFLLIIMAGLAAYWSINILYSAAKRAQIFDYAKLTKEVLGNRYATLLEGAIYLNGFGASIAKVIVSK